jgi:hypothetical protein
MIVCEYIDILLKLRVSEKLSYSENLVGGDSEGDCHGLNTMSQSSNQVLQKGLVKEERKLLPRGKEIYNSFCVVVPCITIPCIAY